MNKEKYFIVLDEENNPTLVIWDKKIFETEYVKLQNQYWDGELEWVDFYDELSERLEERWITIIPNIDVVYHNSFTY